MSLCTSGRSRLGWRRWKIRWKICLDKREVSVETSTPKQASLSISGTLKNSFSTLDWKGVIMAGGFVSRALNPSNSDKFVACCWALAHPIVAASLRTLTCSWSDSARRVSFVLTVPDTCVWQEEAKAKVKYLLAHFKAKTILRTKYSLTLITRPVIQASITLLHLRLFTHRLYADRAALVPPRR